MEEKLNNKTCGECRHFDRGLGICDLTDDFSTVISNTLACVDFEICPKPTNGDVIRQMSNKNLAIFLGDKVYCFTCPIKGVPCFDKPKDVCYQKWFDWLNAPAESEGEDVQHS